MTKGKRGRPKGQYYGPSNLELNDYRYVKEIRLYLGMTLKEFSKFFGTDIPTLSRVERNELTFTPYYKAKLTNCCKQLGIGQKHLMVFKQRLDKLDFEESQGKFYKGEEK